jgi:hypothetical protein
MMISKNIWLLADLFLKRIKFDTVIDITREKKAILNYYIHIILRRLL